MKRAGMRGPDGHRASRRCAARIPEAEAARPGTGARSCRAPSATTGRPLGAGGGGPARRRLSAPAAVGGAFEALAQCGHEIDHLGVVVGGVRRLADVALLLLLDQLAQRILVAVDELGGVELTGL